MDYSEKKEDMRTFFVPGWVQQVLELTLSATTPPDENLVKIGKVLTTATERNLKDQRDRDTMRELLSINQNLCGSISLYNCLMEMRQIIASNYF